MANATLTIDKYSVIQKLEKRGFSQAQAEGIVEALGDINVAQLATTHDLRDISTNTSVVSSSLTVSVLQLSP